MNLKPPKNKVDKEALMFFTFYIAKILLTAFINHFFDKIAPRKHIFTYFNTTVPCFYTFQLFILAQGFYNFHHYEIVGCIFFSFFIFLIQLLNFIFTLKFKKSLVIITALKSIDLFIVVFEVLYLFYNYQKLRKQLVWKNLVKVGAELNSIFILTLREKLRTLLKIFVVLILALITHILRQITLKKDLLVPLTTLAIEFLFLLFNYVLLKSENIALAIFTFIFDLYIIVHTILFGLCSYKKISIHHKPGHYLWNYGQVLVLLIYFYYYLQYSYILVFYSNRGF